jgi:Domain of unknown function (DUF4386)
MVKPSTRTPLRTAALITGLSMLILGIGAPIGEFYILPKLLAPGNIIQTAKNILSNQNLFRISVVGYLINFIGDVVIAWGLYMLLRPVNEYLSILMSSLRVVFAVVALAALLNLITVLQLLDASPYKTFFELNQFYAQMDLAFNGFRNGWTFALAIFGIHLVLLGYLVFGSNYIPKFIGVWLMVGGIGWFVNSIQPFLFPAFKINFTIISITGAGELVFLLWLLIKGARLKEPVKGSSL